MCFLGFWPSGAKTLRGQLLYINDISDNAKSKIKLFADDMKLYIYRDFMRV